MAQKEKDQVRFYEQLYAQHRTLLYRISLALLNDKFLAEDMIHETFSWVIAHPDSLHGRSLSQIKSLLCLICRCQSLSMLRKQKKESPLDALRFQPADDIELSNPINIVLRKESISIVKQIVQELSQLEQDIFLLSNAYNLKASEIAELFGVDVSLIYRATEKIKYHITKKLQEKEMI